MPEVGEYWYGPIGSQEVVRVVEVTDDACSFLVANFIVRPPTSAGCERLVRLELDDFLNQYHEQPHIAHDWLDTGSTWFLRSDANSRVVVEDYDTETEIVTFYRLSSGGIGRAARREFVAQYVRIPNDFEEGLSGDRFWVMGAGICAVFISQADAQAFLYETSALINLSETSLHIYRIEEPGGPPGWASHVPRRVAGSGYRVDGGRSAPPDLGAIAGTGENGLPGSDGTVRLTEFGAEVVTFGAGGAGGVGSAPKPPPEPPTLWERLTTPDE